MSSDVEAILMVGWMIEYEEATYYEKLCNNDFHELEKIQGIEENCGDYWVCSVDGASYDPNISIGWRPDFRKKNPEAISRWDSVPLTIKEFGEQFADDSKTETARQVYRAITGKDPKCDPQVMLFERWY